VEICNVLNRARDVCKKLPWPHIEIRLPRVFQFVIVPIRRSVPIGTITLCDSTSFCPDALRALLLRNQIATLEDLKHALGTPVDVTVFRKLKPLDYLSSYSHRGRFYTLRELAPFDDHGLWSRAQVWFSRFGMLLATAEAFVNRSPRGYFADELAPALHVEVQDALHQTGPTRSRFPSASFRPVPIHGYGSGHPTTTTANAPSSVHAP
jgi:hypothetical protein